ncbi:AraC family transcriptional regulator [Planktotalea sp.]|uniref:AraC family transcriptional regulator n=1 Tax=Planktotalea sp. TaxID=2029877 RepID=UPI0032976D75
MTIERLLQLSEQFEALQGNDRVKDLEAALIFRRDEVSDFESAVYDPFICLILQGGKDVHIGNNSVSLAQGDTLLISHALPVLAKITEASPEKPYRALVFSVDLGILRSLYEEMGEQISDVGATSALVASPADPTYMEPMMRYLELMDAPLDAKVLGPMIVKEIHFRLLMSPVGRMLRSLFLVDSHASRIATAISEIRSSFRETLVMGDLAQIVGMSPSSFHEHFKTVTGTTPLQYQKDLRLSEARGLLMKGGLSVSAVAYDVGYESPTHFSREYSRKFGVSPKNHLTLA